VAHKSIEDPVRPDPLSSYTFIPVLVLLGFKN
jgi:hypothetical protein